MGLYSAVPSVSADKARGQGRMIELKPVRVKPD